MSIKNIVHVVAGIIFSYDGHILLSSRPKGKSYAGFWEFAGGKVETNETEIEALKRELLEELNIQVIEALPWLTKQHEYEHYHVFIHFFWVTRWQGIPQRKEQQQISWQNPCHLTIGPMLAANENIIKALCIPHHFSGQLTKQLQGMLFKQQVILKPSKDAVAGLGLILSQEELSNIKQRPESFKWVVAQINTDHDWKLCAQLGLDAAIISITDIIQLQRLFDTLAYNMPTALIVAPSNNINNNEILKKYACSIIEDH